ncbi:MAG TPA: hypothetical protein PLV97_10890 [Chitinophagales bacterium]|nr:hypothetical protein [Chitinophagales bacterium]HNO49237.1 hypothetical protein [Chitinophagales bacterium]
MKKLYYTIWVDIIIQARKQPKNKHNWKFLCQLFMSLCMGMNISFILAPIDRYFTFFDYNVPIDLFPGNRIDDMLRFFVMFMLPPLILNYFLIFYEDRYKILIEQYEFHNGQYFLWYMIISLGTPFLYMLIFM